MDPNDINREIRQMAEELNIPIPVEITPEFTVMVMRQARQRLSDLEEKKASLLEEGLSVIGLEVVELLLRPDQQTDQNIPD